MELILGTFIIVTMLMFISINKYLKKDDDKLIITDISLEENKLVEYGEEMGELFNTSKKANMKGFILKRLNRSFLDIEKIYLKFNNKAIEDLPKGSEWILDNFYMVELIYKETKANILKEGKINLNIVETGPYKDYPLVYVLTLELINYSTGNITEENIIGFINGFQKWGILSLEEVSSISTCLVLGLLEYIRIICIKLSEIDETWRKVETLDLEEENIQSIIENIHEANFTEIERIVRKIRQEKEDFYPILEKIDNKLGYVNTSIKEVLEKEYMLQSKYKISLGYGIRSLRNIASFDWENIFETLSLVEEVYKNDPLNIYANMDLDSKNYYRYETKILAERFNVKEIFVAKKVLEFAREEWSKDCKDKKGHIGYYLIDSGRERLFDFFKVKENNPGIYLGKYSYYYFPILLFAILISLGISIYGYGAANTLLSLLIFLVIFIPVLTISINLFNYFYSKKYKPSILPKMDFKEGIPEDCATFVVIPTLLPNEERVEELMKNLEVYYLSNRDENIYFGIIGDFKDGEEKSTKEDGKIISKGLEWTKKLNEKYNGNRFYYFHRERTYSKTQEKWMGWERKRGALVEFNDLLSGEETSFNIISGDLSKLKGKIKYIITLDADTILPIDEGKKLIGTISHPLNRAVIDDKKNIVVEGYGIIQPRIIMDMESSNKSLFTRIFAGSGGIDPYSTAVSDIYQDLFGEGIFTGKGIYDLQVFQNVLKENIPENTVLSHDLLEGSYIRVGLATDIKLVDGYPEKYSSYIMRQHRWTRGDWQLIKWLYGSYSKNINSLSKWKILDNMRRSLLPMFLLLTIFLSIIFFPGNVYIGLGLVVINILFPIINMVLEGILYKRFKIQRMKLNGNLILGYKTYIYQGILSFIFLPHEAIMLIDAITRTMYRVFISKKNLLEWTTAFDMEKRLKNDMASYFTRMKENIILSILLVVLTYVFRPENLTISTVIAILWIIGPILAYIISKEEKQVIEIKEGDLLLLRDIARETWEYYRDFTDEKNNYLPPDNFQEYPYNGIANRTSPTNIGFYLISVLSSRDLDFITTEEMVDLIGLTINTIEKMEKWEGHLYNWYDTETLAPLRPVFVSTVDSGNFIAYLIVLKEGLKEYLNSILEKVQKEATAKEAEIEKLIFKMKDLINRIKNIIARTEFLPLYDEKRDLFYIGYNVDENKVLKSYYDLLASEARTASYIAISKGEIPVDHWNKLGKSLIKEKGYISLASWSGTMFEYLMPSLVLKDYANTLLDESNRTSIKMQKDYANAHKVPWGISESGFFAFDRQLNYQYKAFGIPALGFKRGLKDELVISPYASFLALKFDYLGVIENIKRLKSEGLKGKYGFYEAVDYTLSRLPNHLDKGIVKSYMSHHQGMILTSINNLLNQDIMVSRFHRDPEMRCGELLLQEKVPFRPIISKEKENIVEIKPIRKKKGVSVKRVYTKTELEDIQCHVLSSNTYSLMINNRGEGFSKNEDIFINRWRRDYLSTSYGQFIYIKDLKDNNIWSATYAPVYSEPDYYNVEFASYRASFHRRDGDIETKMDVFLLPEELGEIRKITLINNGEEERLLETLSYFEVVGERLNSDLAHPAFNNLFIKTEVLEDDEGLLAHRRKRVEDFKDSWILHGVKIFEEEQERFQYETDRHKFIGRGNSLENPRGIIKGLTNTVGVVLDPIMSIGKKIKLKSNEKIEIYYITALTDSRQEAIEILNKYNRKENIIMAKDLSNTKSQTEIGYLNLNQKNIKFYEELLPYLFYLKNNIKTRYAHILKENIKGKEGLWAHGISGDNPMILVTTKSMEGMETIVKLLDAHEYLAYKGIAVDLIILNEEKSIYHQPLFQNIRETIYERRGNIDGIFLRNKNAMEDEDIALLYKWSDLIINAEEGFRVDKAKVERIPYKEFAGEIIDYSKESISLSLDYFNGYGGFCKGGKEYIIQLNNNLNTPAPWVNVIANKHFGFIITEMGTGFTWSKNSRENKLTPWYNDPVLENPGEIIYLRDDHTGEVFSITPKPIRDKGDYIITHGLGYSSFYHNSHGIRQELTVFVPTEDNIKVNLIKLRNDTNMERKITLVYYIRPVLGVTDEETENLIETQMVEGVFKIKNPTNTEFKNSTMFIGTSEEIKSYTGNRVELLGKVPNYIVPEGLKKERLSNTTGFGYNPCGAIEIEVSILPNEAKELVFLLGESDDVDKGYGLIDKYKSIPISKKALEEIKQFWEERLSKIQVDTPDNSMNYLMNNWLMYQTIGCRIWGRAGYYQVGGAYGARDQMQDTMNALYHVPEEGRRQILENCKHQYKEGDIQHWWHPIPDSNVHKGIRSRYSDDLLWLPLGVSEYILITGDHNILNEPVPFIESPILKEGEHERYEIPTTSKDIGTVYEHCIRAIEKSLNFGERGLPLMGGGDWNDGMNKIGYKGKGESVWLGWFLITVLESFIPICEKVGDFSKVEKYKKIIIDLKSAIETNAWDGEWYKRAFFDNGTPIGSKENSECMIDSIAQSWPMISGAGDIERVKLALKSVENYLVNEEEGIIALLTPPFDSVDLDPGYIKSYVPGVRENGGQYTHAATWVIKAFALLGEGDKAYNLFKMINPINHSKSSIECAKYKVEPYVIAADVYTNPSHLGRGGWTWYTGSSGWMYKVGLEDILGFKVEGDKLYIDPCIPKDWQGYSIKYKYNNTNYNIEIKNSNKVNRGVGKIILDGKEIDMEYINLVDDGVEHFIAVNLGSQ